MAKVTIRGSDSNRNTILPPGVVTTVERTPEINKLISRGYVHVITPPVSVTVTEPEPVVTVAETAPVEEQPPAPVKARRRRKTLVENVDLPDEDDDSDG